MGLFGNRDESKWSVVCEELTTDVELALDKLKNTLRDVEDALATCKRLKKQTGHDKSVLENLASDLESATISGVSELALGAQMAGLAATSLSNIVNGF